MRLFIAPLLAAAFCGGLAFADELSWKDANRKSAEIIRANGYTKEAADLADAAFHLYATQSRSYNARSHAQLLLNAIDARLAANGPRSALDEVDKGTDELAAHLTGDDRRLLLDVWLEGMRIGETFAEAGRTEEMCRKASELAAKLGGENDIGTLGLRLAWINRSYQRRGYNWVWNNLTELRERAASVPGAAEIVSRADLSLARLQISRDPGKGRARYEELMQRLESVADPRQTVILEAAYAQLEYFYDTYGTQKEADDFREEHRSRASARSHATGHYPLEAIHREQPEYPREAQTRQISGYVFLELTIAEDGTVKWARVLDSEPGSIFDKPALRAVVRWTFKPPIENGKPAQVQGWQRIDFRMARS